MDITPFCIQKFSVGPRQQVSIVDIDTEAEVPVDPVQKSGIPAYFVASTAPPNIEDTLDLTDADWAKTERGVDAIATDLYHRYTDSSLRAAPELIITIHGYNTPEKGVKAWYKDIFRQINQRDVALRKQRNLVFIGYRWASECFSLAPANLWRNYQALPPVPKIGMMVGNLLTIGCLIGNWLTPANSLDLFWGVLLSLSASFAALIASLIVLRLSVYFRDVYRATNFGVLDLVELIRRIDKALVDKTAAALQNHLPDDSQVFERACQQWSVSHRKIKLSFIGHSMGALVVTNAVRILSDVFDSRSIDQHPPSDVGHTLNFERLILVAPDIPVLSIISSRTNFLASSLRRFNETYLFSNEGDLALRLASTAANYISFPTATQTRGYRLGNVALTHTKPYGISNLENLRQHFPLGTSLLDGFRQDPESLLGNLYVNHRWAPGNLFISLAMLFTDQAKSAYRMVTLADFFTCFDCTDYRDRCVCFEHQKHRPRKMGLLSRAKRKAALNFWDYIELSIDGMLGRRDVHGGYFQGEYSRQLIYRLAFLGFEGMLKASSEKTPEKALDLLHEQCQQVGIQAYLSPLRYRVDVQGQPIAEIKAELLEKIQAKNSPADGPSSEQPILS